MFVKSVCEERIFVNFHPDFFTIARVEVGNVLFYACAVWDDYTLLCATYLIVRMNDIIALN